MFFLKRPKVTFVMCTYNDKYLENTLQSIYRQTLTEWEMLLFNTNQNRQLKASDKRVKVMNVDNDMGKWVVEGTAMATSNVILNQADDDPNFMERAETCYKYIVKKGADIFTCASILKFDWFPKMVKLYSPAPFDYQYHRLGVMGIGNSMAFGGYNKKTCPKYRREFPHIMDYVLLTEAYFKGCKFMSTDVPLGIRRYAKTSMSFSGEREAVKQIEIAGIRKLFNDELILSERRPVKK